MGGGGGVYPLSGNFPWLGFLNPSLTDASVYFSKDIVTFFTCIGAMDSSSLTRSTIFNCWMRTVKDGCLIASALHIVHRKGGRDRSKDRICSVYPIRIPKHPGQVFISKSYNIATVLSLWKTFCAPWNLQTTTALLWSWKSSQTGNPPTKMFPSWGPEPPTRVNSEICS